MTSARKREQTGSEGSVIDRAAFVVKARTATVSRTLLAAGFRIKRARRQPGHIEVSCERRDVLGATVPYLLVFCDGDEPPAADVTNIRRTAARAGQDLVLVAQTSGPEWISWTDFLAALGGAVPTWRALGEDYTAILRSVAKTELPLGMTGEAWAEHEGLIVADRKVRLAYDLGSGVLLTGEVSRVDVDLVGGGYRAILLGAADQDWRDELRTPLLQRAVAKHFDRHESEVAIGVQALDATGLETAHFGTTDIDDAEAAARALATHLVAEWERQA